MLVCMHTVCMNIYGLCTTWIKFFLHIFMFDCFICNIFIRPIHVFILNFNSFIFYVKHFTKFLTVVVKLDTFSFHVEQL